MSALTLFNSDFSPIIQSRGREYFRGRRVKRLESAGGGVTATVQGNDGAWYHTRIEFDQHGDVVYDCSCTFFKNEGQLCKHLWAVLLTAEQKNVVPTPESAHQLSTAKSASGGASAVEDDSDDTDEGEYQVPPNMIRRPATAVADVQRGKSSSDDWRTQLNRLSNSMGENEEVASASTVAWPANRRILYVVDLAATLSGRGLVVELSSQTLKRDGTGDKPKALKIGREQISGLPDAEDRQILQMLLGAHRGDWGYFSYYDTDAASRFVLPEASQDTTFKLMCETGRARLRRGSEDTPPLIWDSAQPWEFWLEFKPSPGGRYQILDGSLRRGETRIPLQEPDLLLRGGLMFTSNTVSRYDHRGAFDLVAELRDGMKLSVPLDQRDELLRKLLSLPRLPRIDLPEDLELQEVRVTPRPRLTIEKPRRTDDDMLSATLTFDYGGEIVDPAKAAMAVMKEGSKQLLYRDPAIEQLADSRLVEAGFRAVSRFAPYLLQAGRLSKAVSELVGEGWHVEAEGKIYRRPGEFNVQVKSGIDWFEMHGSVSFGDDLFAPLPRLLTALRRGDKTVTLDDGTIGLLPEEWLRRYAPLASLGEENDNHLRFTRHQIGFLDALLAATPDATFDETFTRARDQLMHFEGITPLDPPESFTGELRAYQRDGLGWMQFLRTFNFGGCLADDMGLGKTVQVLALLEARRQSTLAVANGAKPDADTPSQPSLVVVPRSLVFNWVEEAKKFTPNMRVLDHTHAQRQKGADHFEDYDMILATYGTLRRDAAHFKGPRFDYVILDEAQAVKNASSESAKAVRLLSADHRLALSGTPVQNHLGELWSLLEFLNPGMMGSASIFKSTGAGATTVAPETRQLLSRAIRPFVLRRTKEQVAKDLPAKLEQTLFCELEPLQRKLYDELKAHYRTSLLDRIAKEGMNKAKIQVLEALLRLRQAACHPGLIDPARKGESSAKLETLLEHISEVLEENHKILVFSQFTSMLALVRDRLDAIGTPYEYLDGKTRDRQARVDHFQNDPECKLFLISLKAGGLGLNLTAAEYVFLLDPWWNPAVEAQAIDRAHRIGQTQRVFAYRLIAKDTVEEKVLQLQQSKKDLADAIINADNSLIRTLNKEDLELLLS